MKNFILTAALILSVGLNVYYIFFKPPSIRFKTETQMVKVPFEVREFVDSEVKRVNRDIDTKGFEHAVSEAVANTVADVNLVRDSARREMDSVLALRNLDQRQLLKWERYAVSWRDSFLMASQSSDTSYKFNDSGLKLEFVQPKKDKPYFNYQYDADIDYVNYWEKRHFLAKKKNYTDFWVNDTRATINGVKRIRVEAKSQPVSAQFGVTGQYIRSPFVGPSGEIKIGRVKIGGAYLYDLDGREWVPTVSGTYNFIEF